MPLLSPSKVSFHGCKFFWFSCCIIVTPEPPFHPPNHHFISLSQC